MARGVRVGLLAVPREDTGPGCSRRPCKLVNTRLRSLLPTRRCQAAVVTPCLPAGAGESRVGPERCLHVHACGLGTATLLLSGLDDVATHLGNGSRALSWGLERRAEGCGGDVVDG